MFVRTKFKTSPSTFNKFLNFRYSTVSSFLFYYFLAKLFVTWTVMINKVKQQTKTIHNSICVERIFITKTFFLYFVCSSWFGLDFAIE